DVTIPALGLGQTVSGVVAWTAVPAGEPVDHVDFLVDGVERAAVAEAPYTYDWGTAFEADGRHVLTARAVGVDGRTAIATVVVHSSTATPPPPVVMLPGLVPGAAVTGVLDVAPELSGGPVARVELWIDGAVVETSTEAPWTFAWDTTSVAPGPHTLA